MLKLFDRISTHKTMQEKLQDETQHMQAKKEKRLRRQKEAEQFDRQRQAVNDAISQCKGL